MIKVAVVGATGYAGAEVLRYLISHPSVQVVLGAGGSARGVTTAPSGAQAGQTLADALPALRGLTTLPLATLPETPEDWPHVDAIFLALPHGVATDVVKALPKGPKIIDLAADFRINADPFIYGLVENVRSRLKDATHVASPGCFATATLLALSPLVAAGLIEDRVIVDAKTGSTGSGHKPAAGTHHPERANSLYAYKPFKHQHVAEIQAELKALSPAWNGTVLLQAHSTPLVRGIYASVYARLHEGVGAQDVARAYQRHYEGSPFVRLREGPPNVNWSRGSNFADLGWVVDDRELAVFSAIDNLGKGAAGQAVQAFNLMFGLPETMGLWQAGGVP